MFTTFKFLTIKHYQVKLAVFEYIEAWYRKIEGPQV